jgi:transmembrane sensor
LRQVVASDYSDWKEGGLLFNNDSFEEILKTLERVYNVKVHLRTSAYHSNRLTIHFNKHESLENIMMLVKEMIPGLEYQIKEDGIYID